MDFWPSLLSRPAPKPLSARPSLTLFFLLAGAFVLTLVPHVEELPLWISISVGVAMTIRCILEVYRLPLPSTFFCGIMAICLLAGIMLQFNTMLGREAGTAFMAGLLAIKFYELRSPRDLALIIFSCFFVVMSALLYSQALELFIYCLIMMWVLTALLLRIQVGDLAEDQLLRMLQRSGVIFLQALPLTVFLFFFFPRSTIKLQVTLSETSTGLNDNVRPGTIAELAKDDSPAFYVKFLDGDIPTIDSMYWRALVLWDYHHGAWTRGPMAELPDGSPLPVARSNKIMQQITVDPHFKKWLFALEYPIDKAEDASEGPEWSVTVWGDVLQLSNISGNLDHKERYTVTSAPLLEPRAAKLNELKLASQLPGDDPKDDPNDTIDPKVRELADQLRKDNPGDPEYISAVLHYFRHEGFRYSASPGELGKGDWLPQFLFTSKIGFCEHYAAAFAVLMRLEHVPARMVVGYLGAEYNPYDTTYLVKQSNAHAWDEVWLKSNDPKAKPNVGNWKRIDPAAVLAQGDGPVAGANPTQDAPPNEDVSIQIAHTRLTLVSGNYLPGWMRRSMLDMQLRRQQVESNWDDWVFSYDHDAQSQLAQALGFGRDPRFMLGLACFLASGFCALAFRQWMRRKPAASPVETFYTTFCQAMTARGIPRAIWEGPMAYTQRAAEAFPDKKDAIQDVGWIVAHSRYAATPVTSPAPDELKSLLTSIGAASTASSPHESN